MRVTTKAVFDIESGDLLEWEGYDYEDPVELAGGGPSAAQKARIKARGMSGCCQWVLLVCGCWGL